MSVAVAANGLGKRYARQWVLSEATLEIQAGSVAGIIGPNGAGKSTLMQMLVALTTPDAGRIEIFGEELVPSAAQLGRLGFVPQQNSLYGSWTVAQLLRLGAAMNPGWDGALAESLLARFGLNRSRRAGRLSGGQQAQLAIVLAVAKAPDLLVLDEPVASLDPLARRECLQILMEYVAETGATAVLSSHLVADLERVCDHLVVIGAGRVQLTGEVDELLASHRRLRGPRRDLSRLPADQTIVEAVHSPRQSTLLVRTESPILDPSWTVEEVSLEDIALAYMRQLQPGSTVELSR